MPELIYTIFEKIKTIPIDNISKNDNVVKHNDQLYEYKVTSDYQDTFNKLLQLLERWNTFTKTHNITYWATAGSLLGSIRHNGFIPWDNDIDVCVFLSDLDKVKQLLHSHNFKYQHKLHGLSIYDTDINIFIDVFVCDYFDDKTIKYAGFIYNNKPTWYMDTVFPKEFFLSDELYPIREVSFENITINIPNNYQNYLYRCFSDKCLTECKISEHVILHKFSDIMGGESKGNFYNNFLTNIYTFENLLHIPRDKRATRFLINIGNELSTNTTLHKNLNNLTKNPLFAGVVDIIREIKHK